MLIDRAEIRVKAGGGGNGVVRWHREKYIPKGGPDGGDGGDGGDVIIVASPHTHGLREFSVARKLYAAEAGEHGKSKRQHGKNGKDLIINVPPGTVVKVQPRAFNVQCSDAEVEVVDLITPGQREVVALGGKGGLGNVHFATSAHQTPYESTPGEPGEVKYILLELKLIADVGIIGLPNVGKSTLLARLTHAKPEIADYQFTTLEPNLGVLDPEQVGLRGKDIPTLIFADIPGLIKGASSGKGLGHEFLRHIERTTVVLHLVDALSDDPERDYQIIRKELAQWQAKLPPWQFDHKQSLTSQSSDTGGNAKVLTEKPEVVAVSRCELKPEFAKEHKGFVKEHKAILVSSQTGQGLKELVQLLVSRTK
ncbi:GTPase ObgE [Candidatus Berkelbacteria bacterium]|nr:GTPase ObgE [Candidatus Berkelbacteria bacterium]